MCGSKHTLSVNSKHLKRVINILTLTGTKNSSEGNKYTLAYSMWSLLVVKAHKCQVKHR